MLNQYLLRRSRSIFRQGGILAYATESCYGLGCDPRNFKALQRIIRLKKRPNHKGMIIVAANFAQLKPFIQPLSIQDKMRLSKYWPGANTLLLNASRRALPILRGRKRQKIAVRITAHKPTADLCRALGSALVSSSANCTKQRALKSADACRKKFGSQVLTLSGQIGKRKKPSTIVDFATGHILR